MFYIKNILGYRFMVYFNMTSSVNVWTSHTKDFVCLLSPASKSLYDILFLMGKSDLVNICTLMVCTANLVLLLSFKFLQFWAKQKHHKYHATIISSKVLWLLISFWNDRKLIAGNDWTHFTKTNEPLIHQQLNRQTDQLNRQTDPNRKQPCNQWDWQIKVQRKRVRIDKNTKTNRKKEERNTERKKLRN